MYTDPSGEIAFLAAVGIGAAIAAFTYTVTALLADVPFSVGGLAKTTFIGAATSAVTFGIGTAATNLFTTFYSQAAFSAVAHGTFQGTMTAISGGKFWSGFASGALSSIAASAWSGGSTTETNFETNSSLTEGHFVTTTYAHQGISGAIGANNVAGMIAFGTVSGGAGAALTGGNFWQGAVTGLVVSGLNHALHQIDPPKGKTKVLKNTKEATDYYKHGDGSAASLDKSTQLELHNSKEYLRVVRRLISGVANNLNGSFDVDMTYKVFHVGRTNVNYSTNCAGGNCTTTFTEFVNDGFYDPDFISENILGRMGISSSKPDGLGPNLERLGGKPYMYIPSTFKITYPNPGY
ncbi:hypothetical protein [Flavobacterium gyeonganense]|nr:hypothetical protein [Flavobacterium gyeonganense]